MGLDQSSFGFPQPASPPFQPDPQLVALTEQFANQSLGPPTPQAQQSFSPAFVFSPQQVRERVCVCVFVCMCVYVCLCVCVCLCWPLKDSFFLLWAPIFSQVYPPAMAGQHMLPSTQSPTAQGYSGIQLVGAPFGQQHLPGQLLSPQQQVHHQPQHQAQAQAQQFFFPQQPSPQAQPQDWQQAFTQEYESPSMQQPQQPPPQQQQQQPQEQEEGQARVSDEVDASANKAEAVLPQGVVDVATTDTAQS